MIGSRLLAHRAILRSSAAQFFSPKKEDWFLWILVAVSLVWLLHSSAAWAGIRIPGTDASDKLEAAGTLLRLVDSVLFSWGARIFAGLAIMSAGWNLKEQRFGIAVLCVVAAIVLGTAPTWVKNIFDIGGGGGIFSVVNTLGFYA